MFERIKKLFNWQRHPDVVPLWEGGLKLRARFKEFLFGLVVCWRSIRGQAFMGWAEDIPIEVVPEPETHVVIRPGERHGTPVDQFYQMWLENYARAPKRDKDIN